MLNAREIIDIYISFFEKREHKKISNSSLVPQNDPTTLFTSSGMQPLISYLLGKSHPKGRRLVNVQNCFRAQDIEEIGDKRHTTFFRMLGNWSLGNYFKKEEIPWFFEFLTEGLKIDPSRLYVSVFEGYQDIPRDEDSARIWKQIFEGINIDPTDRIFFRGTSDNWWSRSGLPENMPAGEPGGPDTEVYFDLKPEQGELKGTFQELSDTGRLLEIGNSVFMEYQKQTDGSFKKLPQQNVDFGGGLERLLLVTQNLTDVFQTNLMLPIVRQIELLTNKSYEQYPKQMRIITDHFISATFIASENIMPSNKEQGYVLRRLIRRGLDNLYQLGGKEIKPILETVVDKYKETDPMLTEKFEHVTGVILEEEQKYNHATNEAKRFIKNKYKTGDELKGITEISADDAFVLYTTHGLSPTQIKSLGFIFNDKEFARKMEEHQLLSRQGASKKFALESQKDLK